MVNFFFLRCLMPTARKCLLAVFPMRLTPVVKCTIRYAQISRNLCQRLLACLSQLDSFYFKFSRKRPLGLLHGLFPPWWSLLPPVYLLRISGSRPFTGIAVCHQNYRTRTSTIAVIHSPVGKAANCTWRVWACSAPTTARRC